MRPVRAHSTRRGSRSGPGVMSLGSAPRLQCKLASRSTAKWRGLHQLKSPGTWTGLCVSTVLNGSRSPYCAVVHPSSTWRLTGPVAPTPGPEKGDRLSQHRGRLRATQVLGTGGWSTSTGSWWARRCAGRTGTRGATRVGARPGKCRPWCGASSPSDPRKGRSWPVAGCYGGGWHATAISATWWSWMRCTPKPLGHAGVRRLHVAAGAHPPDQK